MYIRAEKDKESLLDEIRNVELKNRDGVYPYRESSIEILSVSPSDTIPLAKYVHREKINSIRMARREIIDGHDTDILKLNKLLRVERNGNQHIISPPVLEKINYYNDPFLGIVDGLHRCYIARQEGLESLSCIVIRGYEHKLPFRPVDWSNVKIVDSIPDYVDRRRFDSEILSEISESNTDTEYDTLEDYSRLVYRDLPGSDGVR